MSKINKRQNLEEAENQLEELEAYRFQVEKKEPWHWRIRKPDYDMVLDVWATVKKYWEVGTNNRASFYQNFLPMVFKEFGIESPFIKDSY